MAEITFCDGMRFDPPTPITKEKAPWIKGKLSFKVDDAVAFLLAHKNDKGWMNADLCQSKESGKLYLKLNEYKKVGVDENGFNLE